MDILRKYIELFKDLHYLVKVGDGEGIIANKIRDKMDAIWYELSEHEKEEVGYIAVELNKSI